MSNLGFELWWAGGTTTLLTTQPQVGSQLVLYVCQWILHVRYNLVNQDEWLSFYKTVLDRCFTHSGCGNVLLLSFPPTRSEWCPMATQLLAPLSPSVNLFTDEVACFNLQWCC
jgi:hypothetical protein